jgi:hypothetical protein
MVLRAFYESFPKRYKGFYVDIGAHHPVRFSNTYYFYKKGWKGVNIDATPGSMYWFKWLRRRDLNLELGIGGAEGVLTFYCFDEPALNTLSKEVAELRSKNGPFKLKCQIDIPIMPLSDVLAAHCPAGQKIDFLSVDVEGMDEVVLRSNDWQQYRPMYVLAEDSGFEMDATDHAEGGVYQFLVSQGYKLVAKTKRTLIFQDCEGN